MHVALFSPSWPPQKHANGIVTYVYSMKAALERKGVKVTVISAFDWRESYRKQMGTQPLVKRLHKLSTKKFLALTGKFPDDFSEIRYELCQYISILNEKCKFDILEIEETQGFATEVIKNLALKTVVRVHGPHFCADRFSTNPGSQIATKRINAELQTLNAAVAISCPASSLLSEIEGKYLISQNIRAHIFNPLPNNMVCERDKISSSQSLEILFVGRFDRPKGADICLKAFERVLSKLPKATLTMAGPDSGFVAECGSTFTFQQYCARYVPKAVQERVTFYGLLTAEELSGLRQRAGVCLITSRYETFSYVVVESMLAAKPVVATRSNGTQELIQNKETGYLAENENPESVADAILLCLLNTEASAAIARAAQAWCLKFLDPDPIASKTLALYESLLDR